jgi:uncharacterized membrane protein
MTEWFYARGGQQSGPVSYEELADLAKKGDLNPQKDLVWNQTMKDWLHAGQVPGLFGFSESSESSSSSSASPAWDENTGRAPETILQEITPGSHPIEVKACIQRGFTLVCRNAGKLLLVGLIYFVSTIALKTSLTIMDNLLDLPKFEFTTLVSPETTQSLEIANSSGSFAAKDSALNIILTQLFSLFLSLGLTQIGLKMIAGKEFSVGLLFKGGKQFLPLLGATILISLILIIGFICLVIPGIYLTARLSYYLPAMVDRKLGPINSLKYSWSITTDNTWNLIRLSFMYFLIGLAGILAFCVGIFLAAPIIWLTSLVVYRWLQYGRLAIQDQPGTETPLLKNM